jgi:formamidopyrimidine-DNA glycosylase
VPEIPEIRAHAERLTEAFTGSTLSGFAAMSFTVLKTFDPRPDAAVGIALDEVTSYAKYLMLRFGEITYVVHLMQGGRLKPDLKQSKKPRGGLARWTFEDGTALLLTEPGTEHRAGVWVVAGDPLGQVPINEIAPEATSLSPADLHELFGAHGMRLHGFLRDQQILSGLGRRLSNEICHKAKMSPFANTRKLDLDAAHRVHAAMVTVVEEGLAYDRAQSEMSKSAERPSSVHSKAGLPCPVCDDTVRTVEYRRYTVSYCPTCQTKGKALADNTTSKFLK